MSDKSETARMSDTARMRPALVLLLVAAAATAFLLALSAGEPEEHEKATKKHTAPAPTDLSDPAPVPSLVSAGDRASATKAPPEETRTLHPEAQRGNALVGRVVLANGRMVAGARVVLTRYGPTDIFAPFGTERVPDRETETDEEGNFTFTDLEVAVDYTVVASHPDHGRRTEPYLSVADGQITEPVRIELRPGSLVRGAITDTSSQGIDGAQVRLSLLSVGDLEDGAGVLRAVSDLAGAYDFENVSPGHYTLTVEKTGFGKVQLQRIEIGASSELVHDVTLEVAHLIAGTVRSRFDGAPIAEARVEAYSSDRRQEATNTFTLTGEDGTFELDDVRQGSYTLLVRAQGFENKREPRVETGEVTLDLELVPLPQVSGVVLDPAGRPLANYTVQLRQPLANTTQTVAVTDTRENVRRSADGAFTLACPRVGEFLVEATHPRFAASFSERFSIEKGGSMSGVIVRMTGGGALTGRLVNTEGDPVSGAVVKSHHTDYVDDPFWRSLGDSYPSAAARKDTRTNAEGEYSLEGLTPEAYQLTFTHPEYAPVTARELQVEEGRTVSVPDTILARGASIAGTVFGPAGAGLPGALVQVVLDTQTTGSEFGAFYKARTNAEGRYAFHHLPPGQYKVSVQRQGAADNPFVGMTDSKATRRSIHLVDGKPYTQDFTLSN